MSSLSNCGGFTPIFGEIDRTIGRGRVDGFLHHIAQLTGGLHPTLAGQFQRLDMQQITAYGRPGQTGHDADLVVLLGQTIAELRHTQEIIQIIRRHRHGVRFFLDDLGQRFPRDLGDFPFKVPNARLAGVSTDDRLQRLIGQFELFGFQTVVLDLFADQVLLGDLGFFLFGVTGQRDDLHPVQQRPRHVVAVRRGQEHHVGQVIFDLKIVIHKRVVLFRVQHLQHRRSRIPTEVLPHLVDFIEQDKRVRGFRLFQRLDDLAGH